MEDWNAIAAEVDEAIKSVSSDGNGFPAALRREGASTGEPFDKILGAPTYATLFVIDDQRKIRNADGTLSEQTRRTLMVGTGAGIVPKKSDTIAVGIKGEDADEQSPWNAILEVRPLAPVGVTLLYEIDLAT